MLGRKGESAEGSNLREPAAPERGEVAGRGEATSPRGAEAPAGEAPPARAPRRSLAWRGREAGATVVGTAGAGVLLLARLVMAVASLIAVLIALAIVLRDVDANATNTIVKGIHEGANFFAGAFTGLIRFGGHPKRAITVDWGIALVVYLVLGAIVSRAIASVGRGGVLFGRRSRPAVSNY